MSFDCSSIDTIEPEFIVPLVQRLKEEGFFLDKDTPFTRVLYDHCWSEIQALLQQHEFNRPLRYASQFFEGYGVNFVVYDPTKCSYEDAMNILEQDYQHYQGEENYEF